MALTSIGMITISCEVLGQVEQADRFDPVAKTKTFRARIDYETAIWLEISAGMMETTIDFRRQAAFYLDRP